MTAKTVKTSLQCLLFPDLLPWERESFSPLFQELAKALPTRVIDVNDSHRNRVTAEPNESVWMIARDWRNAIEFIGARRLRNSKVFVSVMELGSPRENIYKVLLKNIWRTIPESITVFVHSPLNLRFFTEFEKKEQSRIKYLSLPFPENRVVKPKSGDVFTVGTFGPFVTDSHLNFAICVCYYLYQKCPNSLRFRFLGSGPLYAHTAAMINQLGLENFATVVETVDASRISDLDVLLHCPLRNDHFLSLQYAAAAGVPVVSTELPGVEGIITDGHSGFILPVNDTKPLAELILRLFGDSVLRESLAKNLMETSAHRLSASRLVNAYLNAFSVETTHGGRSEKAA